MYLLFIGGINDIGLDDLTEDIMSLDVCKDSSVSFQGSNFQNVSIFIFFSLYNCFFLENNAQINTFMYICVGGSGRMKIMEG